MERAVAVLMRVPGLFIIDYWWQHDRGKSLPHSTDHAEILNCLATNLVLLHGFLLLLLPLCHVRAMYTHFVSALMLYTCHLVSEHYVDIETAKEHGSPDPNYVRRQAVMLSFQGALGVLISYLMHVGSSASWPVYVVYVLPVLVRLADFPMGVLPAVHGFCDVATLLNAFLYTTSRASSILDCAKLAFVDARTVAETHGLGTLLVVVWNKLFVPTHFALFWLIEFCVKLLGSTYYPDDQEAWYGRQEGLKKWYLVLLTTVSSICDTPVALVATSVVISYMSYVTLCCTRAFLQGRAHFFQDNPVHSGWTEGLALLLLAVQTGLTEIRMPDRAAITLLILFIILSSLLQSVLEIAEPVVLGLGAQQGRGAARHLRALALCFFLLLFPLYLSKVWCSMLPVDFWMLVVLSSCLLTSVQVLDLLVVHALFLWDARRTQPWDALDDVVYYTRALTKVLELLVGIFVVCMGLRESTLGKTGWLNGSILLIHCYFNVWQRLCAGWRSFLCRRGAAARAAALPAATLEQLERLDDVCPICYSPMGSGCCVTPCHHFFHRTCLRKWLYVQDKCPLCHGVVVAHEEQPAAS